MNIIEALRWRYATKKMNGTKVSKENIDIILESIRLTASSIGLQPYSVKVISNKELLEKIYPIANNQTQILDCSHVIVFCAWDNLSIQRIDEWIQMIEKQRGSVLPRLHNFANNLKEKAKNLSEQENFVWISKQVYIALGSALIAAASLKIDSTPMEGYEKEDLDELLQLPKQGLRSVVIMPIGYRDAPNDFLVNEKKVRRPIEEFIEWID